MRAVFINNSNPATPHVSGMRVAYFADAMARRGHRIVLLTATLDPEDNGNDPHEVGEHVMHWDGRNPLHFTCRPNPSVLLEAIRTNRFPAPIRRLLTAGMFATQGGVHGDWVTAARPIANVLAEKFQPQIVWATFGNTSNLVLAQALARQAGCPWMIDIKDSWSVFLRPGVRELMAYRFRDAAGYTCNAHHHASIAARWHRQPHTVVYSGVAKEMIATPGHAVDRDFFRIALIGSIYDSVKLHSFLSGLERWLSTLSPDQRCRIEFHYAGGAASEVRSAIRNTGLSCKSRIEPYLPLADLGRLCQQAAVNCYLWAPFGFHHKFLELIACRRPVVSFPGEHAESIALAKDLGGDLRVCTSEYDLQGAFDPIWHCWQQGIDYPVPVDARRLTWDAMSERLETFMLSCLQANPRSSRGRLRTTSGETLSP